MIIHKKSDYYKKTCLNYAFTKNIALTVGYQLLHLSAAALAGQENSVQSVVYQGGRLGVNIAF